MQILQLLTRTQVKVDKIEYRKQDPPKENEVRSPMMGGGANMGLPKEIAAGW